MKRKRKGRRGKFPHGRPSSRGENVIGIRIVELLELCAGHRQATGEAVSMLTVSNGDDIETIAFNMRDTKRLAILSLAALAQFNVATASQILQAYFMNETGIQINLMDDDID